MPAIISAIFILAATSCSGRGAGNDNLLVPAGEQIGDDVRAGCELAATKCTRCHTIERLLRARVPSPRTWQRYVARMRLMPGAGIGASDEPAIVRCLVYRSFGDDGLRALEEAAP